MAVAVGSEPGVSEIGNSGPGGRQLPVNFRLSLLCGTKSLTLSLPVQSFILNALDR